ncbi:MAG: hypothetical protein GY769_20295 [bacterium]|nr:hypothetical protein [bacterium]
MWKRGKKRRSKRDLKAVVDKRKKDDSIEFEVDEVTDIIDLSLEQTKRVAEECQEEVRETVEKIKDLRRPAPGPTEEAG